MRPEDHEQYDSNNILILPGNILEAINNSRIQHEVICGNGQLYLGDYQTRLDTINTKFWTITNPIGINE